VNILITSYFLAVSKLNPILEGPSQTETSLDHYKRHTSIKVIKT